MSGAAITWAAGHKVGSPAGKAVLLMLANHANERHQCWPSSSALAESTELTKRTVLTQLAHLESLGLITRTARDRDDGSRASDVITLMVGTRAAVREPSHEEVEDEGGGEMVSPPGEIASPPDEVISPGVVKQFHQGGEMVSPLTTFEPPLNLSSDPSDRRDDAPPEDRGSGWVAALVPAEPPIRLDPNKEGWDRGVRLLRSQGGLSEPAARKLFGMVLSRYRLEARELLPSIVAAENRGTLDPQGYIVRAARAVSERRGSVAPSAADPAAWTPAHWATAVDIWRTERSWPSEAGPAPGSPGCRAPPNLLLTAAADHGEAA